MRTAVLLARQKEFAGLAECYLKKAELVRRLVRPDDQGLDIPHIDVAAGNGEGWKQTLVFERGIHLGVKPGLTEI